MSSPESSSSVVAEDEDEEEDQLYQFIYEMVTIDEKEVKEEAQVPPSSGPTPVQLKKSSEKDGAEEKTTRNTAPAQRQKDEEADSTKGDIDTLTSIQEIPVQKPKAKEKPWRKADADISDYFNYGFDEESWNTYCKKQSKLCAAHRKLYKKIKVQKGHTRREEKESCSATPSSGNPATPASRQSSATADAIRGQPGPSGRVEKHGNNTQVDTEMSPKENRITSYHLPAPSSSPFEFTPPPPFLWRRGPRPLSSLATLGSGQSKGFDDPSSSQYTCSSGVSSLIPRSMSSRAGLINTAKAWERYILQEKRDVCRGRSGKHGRAEVSKRGRGRGRESCSSSCNSREERLRHRDTTERGHKQHSFKRFSGEKEQPREKRRRGKNDGWQKPSCSSSESSCSRSSREGGEDRDSQRQSRRKHKKAIRIREDTETNKRNLKSD